LSAVSLSNEVQTHVTESPNSKLKSDRDSIASDFEDSSEAADALHTAYENLLAVVQLYITGDFMTFVDAFPTLDQDATDDPAWQSVYVNMQQDYENNLTNRLYQMAVSSREQLGKRQDAITICDKILSIDETYDDALFYKALCYEELRNTEMATELYLDYLAAFPNGTWVQEVRNNMQRIAPYMLQQYDSGALGQQPGLAPQDMTLPAETTAAVQPPSDAAAQPAPVVPIQ